MLNLIKIPLYVHFMLLVLIILWIGQIEQTRNDVH